jgi:hypothetical protein
MTERDAGVRIATWQIGGPALSAEIGGRVAEWPGLRPAMASAFLFGARIVTCPGGRGRWLSGCCSSSPGCAARRATDLETPAEPSGRSPTQVRLSRAREQPREDRYQARSGCLRVRSGWSRAGRPGRLVRYGGPMGVNESGSAEQGGLVPATVKTTWASAGGVLDRAQATAGMPGKDLIGNRDSAGHMMMDGFIWHSISCVCDSCVCNDKTFRVTFNRQDFRPFMIAEARFPRPVRR